MNNTMRVANSSELTSDIGDLVVEVRLDRPDLIISGGQSGSDTGGLLAAEDLEIATGGLAPAGFRTENGSNPALGTRFGLVESNSHHYDVRTGENIQLADAVILIANKIDSPGSRLTRNLALKACKPLFEVKFPTLPHLKDENVIPDIQLWLSFHEPSILMIAGNRESVAPGIERWTREFLLEVFA